jgi:TorA maturation chaperone TorD
LFEDGKPHESALRDDLRRGKEDRLVTRKGTDALSDGLGRFRAAFYLLLSRAFSREQDWETLNGVEQVSGGLMEAWELMEIPSDPDVQEGKSLLRTFFSGLRQNNLDGVIEQLAREYASLFLGVGPKTVSLCESVYRSTSGLLYQSPLLEVRQSYRETGMAKTDQYREPDDHIAVELSYMARLCEMTQEAAEGETELALRCLMLQQAFLDDHLLRWIPLFAQQLIATAPSGFYRAMAHLLKGYIGIDRRLIDSMTHELNLHHKPKSKRRQKGSEQ